MTCAGCRGPYPRRMSDWTTDDIDDQTGRTFLITGANSGIGFEAAKALVHKGAHVVLACRSLDKAEEAVRAIESDGCQGSTEVLELDLADLESIRAAAEAFLAEHDRLDVLVNNAGLMATPKRLTAQGVELQFGVNHLGHFVLTDLLLDLLASTGTAEEPARVVTVSSQAHRQGKMDLDDLDASGKYSPWGAYGRSKLANLLFTRELNRRCADAGRPVIAVAAHPGGSSTNLGNEPAGDVMSKVLGLAGPAFQLFMQSAAKGALPTLMAAVDGDVDGGDYFGPDGFGEMRGHPKKVGMTSAAQDDAVAAQLWETSVELTGVGA